MGRKKWWRGGLELLLLLCVLFHGILSDGDVGKNNYKYRCLLVLL